MLKILSIALLTLSTLVAFASEAKKCTEWTKQDGVTCLFAGQSADLYQRQCDKPCYVGPYGHGNMGPNCDQEQVCNISNPTTFNGPCSEWIPVSGVTCYDPNSQSWEQQWARSCTIGLKDTWCSHDLPAVH